MAIDIAKAIDGTFYPFREELVLDDSLLDGRIAKFTSKCEVVGNFSVIGTQVYFDAECIVNIDFACDKCLDTVSRELHIAFGNTYFLEGGSEEGDYSYSNFVVDIAEGVRETVLLALPTRVLCREDCKGICQVCGINLNKGSCDCQKVLDTACDDARNPFTQLKNLNNFSGGTSNGITKV